MAVALCVEAALPSSGVAIFAILRLVLFVSGKAAFCSRVNSSLAFAFAATWMWDSLRAGTHHFWTCTEGLCNDRPKQQRVHHGVKNVCWRAGSYVFDAAPTIAAYHVAFSASCSVIGGEGQDAVSGAGFWVNESAVRGRANPCSPIDRQASPARVARRLEVSPPR